MLILLGIVLRMVPNFGRNMFFLIYYWYDCMVPKFGRNPNGLYGGYSEYGT